MDTEPLPEHIETDGTSVRTDVIERGYSLSYEIVPEAFDDERIPEEFQAGDDLYGSNDLDRGHIGRRADLLWGTSSEAQQANEDTFHFTNIAPQMADFTQSGRSGVWGRSRIHCSSRSTWAGSRCRSWAFRCSRILTAGTATTAFPGSTPRSSITWSTANCARRPSCSPGTWRTRRSSASPNSRSTRYRSATPSRGPRVREWRGRWRILPGDRSLLVEYVGITPRPPGTCWLRVCEACRSARVTRGRRQTGSRDEPLGQFAGVPHRRAGTGPVSCLRQKHPVRGDMKVPHHSGGGDAGVQAMCTGGYLPQGR